MSATRESWRLAWPLILSNLSVPLLGVVDTAVMGHLDSPRYLGGVEGGRAARAHQCIVPIVETELAGVDSERASDVLVERFSDCARRALHGGVQGSRERSFDGIRGELWTDPDPTVLEAVRAEIA